MKLYDKLIENIYSVLPCKADKYWDYSPAREAKPGDKNTVIFRNEAAFELGAAEKSSVCSVLFTSSEEITDSVLLYGRDIPEINGDSPFAHFVIVSLYDREEFRYEELKEIEFSVYRLHPEGYGVRISPLGGRETVRVAEKARAAGLSFENIGNSCITEFKKDPLVKNVRVIFSTLEDIDYKSLCVTAKKAGAVTKTLASDFFSPDLSCEACAMKPLCDEIDGLRELHFSRKNNK